MLRNTINFDASRLVCEERTIATPARIGTTDKLNNWPVKISLVNPDAVDLIQADVVIAADCCAYAYANFFQDFVKDNVVLIGCPKLERADYVQKLTQIFSGGVRSITLLHMTIPCCSGLKRAVQSAYENCNLTLPLRIITLDTNGEVAGEVRV